MKLTCIARLMFDLASNTCTLTLNMTLTLSVSFHVKASLPDAGQTMLTQKKKQMIQLF